MTTFKVTFHQPRTWCMCMHPIFHRTLGTDYSLVSLYQATARRLFKNDLRGWIWFITKGKGVAVWQTSRLGGIYHRLGQIQIPVTCRKFGASPMTAVELLRYLRMESLTTAQFQLIATPTLTLKGLFQIHWGDRRQNLVHSH